MRQTITMDQLKSAAGDIMSTVRLRGDRYVVSRYGKPVAAIVPLKVLEAYEENRERLFEVIDEIRAHNADRDPEKLEAAIDKSVAEVRKARRAKRSGQKSRS